MDVSSSTSFESSSVTMDNNSSSYTGETTLYDSALENLSATAYKSCNDVTETSNMESRCQLTEAHMKRIYHDNHGHVCRSRSVSKAEKHALCMRWLNASYNCFDPLKLKCNAEVSPRKAGTTTHRSGVPEKHHKLFNHSLPMPEESHQKTDATYSYRMVSDEHHKQDMKQPQFDRWHGHMEASFVEPSKLKTGQKTDGTTPFLLVSQKLHKPDMKQLQLERQTTHGHMEASFIEPSKVQSERKSPCSKTSDHQHKQAQLKDSIALKAHHKLKLQQKELVRQIDAAKLSLSVLQIETDHAENTLVKAIQKRELKGPFTDETKENLYAEALKALKAQTVDTFPKWLLSELFSNVLDDDQLLNQFSNLDLELGDIVQAFCVENYELKKESQTKTIKRKLEALKQMLVKKCQKQIHREEKSYQKRAASLKNKCFDLLKQFLKNNIPDNECKELLKELQAAYEQDTEKSLTSDISHSSMPTNGAIKADSADLSSEAAAFKAAASAAPSAFTGPTPALNASMLLIQSESTDTNTSQEEVDPKSQLANKTIFKTDNPNLSIIEINDNSIKAEDLEKEVVLIEGDNVKPILKKSPSKGPALAPGSDPASVTDKRRRKTESLLQTSKQKLDISIAEASAAADGDNDNREVLVATSNPDQPLTKRDITIYDTLEEFDQNLPSTVTLLNTPFGSKVYLVGTAHFSEESQDDVSFVIRNVRPDVVMVELCPSRIHILKLDEKTLLEEAKNINIPKIRGILQTHGYINGVFFILLLQMSAQIAKDLGMAPGGEFRRAFEEIHKLPGCILHLGDRPIRITLYRALRALSLWQTMKLVWRLTFIDSISIEEVEECKQRDLLEKLMQEMAGEFPAFSDVFVRERDLFLCHSLQVAALPQAAPGGSGVRPVRVVGVVGIGHANGIAKMWGHVDPEKIPAILEIPPASLGQRVCKFTLKYGLIGLGCYGVIRFARPRLTRFF